MQAFAVLLFYCGIGAAFVGPQEMPIKKFPIDDKLIVCFVSIWSVFRQDRGEFTVENINPSLCTHIVFGYNHLNATTDDIITFETWEELLGNTSAVKISEMKRKNANLKALVSVGGWLDGSIKYSQMAANKTRRERFVNNTVNFIKNWGFDGIYFIWQYPSKRGGSPRDKENYIQLLKIFRRTYTEENLILMGCVGSSKDTIDYGYDIPKISELLDYMLVHTFDYHGWWSRITGANSPLNGPDFLNTNYSINYLLKLGAEPSKLILGIPFFARSFILNDTRTFDRNNPKFGQKFMGHGFRGPFTEEDGFLGYNEVCLFLKNTSENWTVYRDVESSTPIAIYEDKMISYDDRKSIILKVKFALNHRLGGIFVYSIDNDDFYGDCNSKYPLLTTVNDELSKYRYKTEIYENNINSKANTNFINFNRYPLSLLLSLVIVKYVL